MKDRLFRFKHFRNRFILRILSEKKLLQNAQSLCNLVQIAFFSKSVRYVYILTKVRLSRRNFEECEFVIVMYFL